MPLDKISIAASSGLIASMLPPSTSPSKLNASTPLKLGPPHMLEKLKEEVMRVIREEEEANGEEGGDKAVANGHANGVDANGDVEMGDAAATRETRTASPTKKTIKIEPDEVQDPDLIRPDGSETLPPQPTFYKITDVKREVEAVRDKRKMIRLGPRPDEKTGASTVVLPSVVAFTMHDAGES